MCIIAIKKKGAPLPNENIMKTMFENNPDGAGFCYNYKGKVIIEKGFMTYRAFSDALKRVDESIDVYKTGMIFHFRIATHGGVKPALCHPFPLTDKLNQLRSIYTYTNLAVVHNGVIPIKTKGAVSDTMEYIRSKLYKRAQNNPEFYKSKRQRKAILAEIKSKMAFLDCNGDIYTIGDFITDKGIMYSNTSYEERNFYFDFLNSCGEIVLLTPIEEGYILTSTELIDCEEGLYYIDKHGRLYEYDDYYDFACEVSGTAYTHSGMHVLFDENNAVYVNVI